MDIRIEYPNIFLEIKHIGFFATFFVRLLLTERK